LYQKTEKVNRPPLKKPKIENFGRPPSDAKIFFFQDSVNTTLLGYLGKKSIRDAWVQELFQNAASGFNIENRQLCLRERVCKNKTKSTFSHTLACKSFRTSTTSTITFLCCNFFTSNFQEICIPTMTKNWKNRSHLA
jgi:hypothetical protein